MGYVIFNYRNIRINNPSGVTDHLSYGLLKLFVHNIFHIDTMIFFFIFFLSLQLFLFFYCLK